ncbi:MAG TPA: 2'-5' RNA ligase family protein [Mycobacteriales bacterium]|nr:2'-5' RNA ligase family protein [Mycobacteriales bacterium]
MSDGEPRGLATRDVGIAIGIPEPYGSELQAWRERLGDPNATRIVPHVTLVPPTRVEGDALVEIEEHLRVVATTARPFEVRLRGTGTFLPVSSVVFVSLSMGIAECEVLENKVRSGPLVRERGYPYHPHVTVAHDLPDEALYRALTELADYTASFEVLGLTLFEQGLDGVWRPQRDYTFGGGGLPGPPEERHARVDEGW